MQLNQLQPAEGSKFARKRLGRGIGSGLGKTSGKGHKGQKARAGGYHKVGFEGGQMPIQRRLPKFGFSSLIGRSTAEVRLCELSLVKDGVITVQSLKDAGVITKNMKRAKIFLSGTIEQAVTVSGLRVTKGAKAAIEAAGGKVED
jgi:large subunit ribosomal protein L15